jgi:site-specific recombinase XerD
VIKRRRQWPHRGRVPGGPDRWTPGLWPPRFASFRLHLAAEGKSPKTIRLYTEAVTWFAAARLLGQAGKTGWQQADAQDVQEWMAWLLSRYSDAYASNQYRALQQFFKWLSVEEDVPDLRRAAPAEGRRQARPGLRRR